MDHIATFTSRRGKYVCFLFRRNPTRFLRMKVLRDEFDQGMRFDLPLGCYKLESSCAPKPPKGMRFIVMTEAQVLFASRVLILKLRGLVGCECSTEDLVKLMHEAEFAPAPHNALGRYGDFDAPKTASRIPNASRGHYNYPGEEEKI